MSKLGSILDSLNITLKKFDPEKPRPIFTDNGPTSLAKFSQSLKEKLGQDIYKDLETVKMLSEPKFLMEALEEYSREISVHVADLKAAKSRAFAEAIPEEYNSLTLNLDPSHVGRDIKFYMTTKDEYMHHLSGTLYIRMMQMEENDAIAIARKLVPEYMPRAGRGASAQISINGDPIDIFNVYNPPQWMAYEGKLPDKLPPLFEKLICHILPLKIEREYFFSWLYYSLFERAYVYLILCGAPAVGKNRLKLVLRALHGFQNTIDGKKSTLVERFNSQLADATLAWFDELHYTSEMENVMKELQNDTISIERKGVDATRSTRIYSSLVISNNKPRDNYIAFDARKFAPLVVNPKRLETSMTPEEITELSKKIEDWTKPEFDVAFIAQIGRWIKKHGKSKKWPNLEYKGPMFYKLAHTSMSKWQKKALTIVMETDLRRPGPRMVVDLKKGFLWSSIEEFMNRKGERTSTLPEYSTVKHFFDVFVDAAGEKSFDTLHVENSITNDFWVRPLSNKVKILTELELSKEIGVSDEDDEEDYSFL